MNNMIFYVINPDTKARLENAGCKVVNETIDINGQTVWTLSTYGCSLDINDEDVGEHIFSANLRITF